MTIPENVRMSALLKRGGRTDIWSDETSAEKPALTSTDSKRPDETSEQTSGRSMSVSGRLEAELDARFAEQIATATRRREARARQRRELAQNRQYGLQQRHARKEARCQSGPS